MRLKFYPLGTLPIDELYPIMLKEEPHMAALTRDMFIDSVSNREGFVIKTDDGITIGSVLFSNFLAPVDVCIHCTVMSEYRNIWCSRAMLRQLGEYVFGDGDGCLNLPRMSSFCYVGLTDYAGKFLERLGFKVEGNIRGGAYCNEAYHDLRWYGMLRSECRWWK